MGITKDAILREQLMGRIDLQFRELLDSRMFYPETRIMSIPIINNVIQMCEPLQLPDNIVYKLAIVEYHKALSTVITDKLNEILLKTSVENIIVTIKGD